MKNEIDRINQILPNNLDFLGETQAMKDWIESVINRMEYYKTVHQNLLKEITTLLELALWKAKLLDEGENNCRRGKRVKNASIIDVRMARRKEQRITSGASTVIKNVLPFIELA